MSTEEETIRITDPEKGLQDLPHDDNAPSDVPPVAVAHDDFSSDESTLPDTKLYRLARRVERLTGIEARGIHRVTSSEQTPKTTLSFMQIVLLWLGINTAAQNITLASIGQPVFGLGFTDAALCSVFGGVVGSIPAAYMATWGPLSGNRTLVSLRQALYERL